MSMYLYDEALVAKFKNWTAKTKATVLGPSESRRLFEIIADENKDTSIKLPIISINRVGGCRLNQTTKQPHTYDGRKYNVENGESTNLRFISASIDYRLDIYTRQLKEADEYVRELVFAIINHPTFKITFPYMSVNYEVNANVFLSEEIEDNSDIPERLINGQFYRMSINLTVDDAYLFDIPKFDVVYVDGMEIEMYKEENSEDKITEKIQLDD